MCNTVSLADMAIPLSSMEILTHSRHENIVWILNIGTMRVCFHFYQKHRYCSLSDFTNTRLHSTIITFVTVFFSSSQVCLSSQNEKIQGKAH